MSSQFDQIEKIDIQPGMLKPELDRLLYAAYQMNASDISIQSDDYVVFMISGRQVVVSRRTLQQFEIETIVNTLYGTNGVAMISQGTPLDPRYEIRPSRGVRVGFRVNMLPSRVDGNDASISITMRVLPKNPMTIEEIGVPYEIVRFSLPRNGLVVIAGVTSSGKSTLIAGLLRYAYEIVEDNEISSAGRKIITYESPVEYVFDGIKTVGPKISQTEVGGNGNGIKAWPMAVETAMRRSASIVLIGECRDGETIDGCISMALTGHCTLTTVHANKVSVAFRRMVAMAAEKGGGNEAVTERLLGSLSMIAVQTLCPKIGGGRVALREWIVITKTLQERLFNLPPASIANELQKEVDARGTSMGHSALIAYNDGLIALKDACAFSGLTQEELMALSLDGCAEKHAHFTGGDQNVAS